MELLWPTALLLLVALPLVVALYVWALRRRRRFAVRFSSLSLVRAAMPRHSWLRRHLPFALFLLALASLITAVARPVAAVEVPSGSAKIVLALDVSRSMLQDDIAPSRLVAAQEAALSFIERQEPGTELAIVAFGGFAQLVQPPTSDQEALRGAIISLTAARGTAIGSGIVEALEVITGVPDSDLLASAPTVSPDGPAAFVPDIIVVLTDGVTTTGPAPLDVAQLAAAQGVRVYTIGFGTERGGNFAGGQGGSGFGGGGFGGGGRRFRRGIDEATLMQVAQLTGAKYYAAESADELQQVFSDLPLSLSTRQETTEISAYFTALGAILAAVGVGLSLAWNRFP